MIRIPFLSVILFWFSACAVGGVVRISRPTLEVNSESSFRLDDDGIFHVGDLYLSIKPANGRVPVLFPGPVLPIFPVGAGSDATGSMPLNITFYFETKVSDYSFEWREIILSYSGTTYVPEEAVGPLTTLGWSQELERVKPGHSWTCVGFGNKRFETATPPSAAIPNKGCIRLRYNVKTPSPDDPFDLTLGGIKKSEQSVGVPTIGFRPGSAAGLSFIGN